MVARSIAPRIGVLGGTFDPPHIGHLIIAEQARQQLHLDRVLFVPAHIPPHKKNGATASPQQRLTMVEQAIAQSPAFEVSPIEIRRLGISYTIDTLRELREIYRRAKFFLIVGGDNFAGFRNWKSVGDILKLATIVVYKRNAVRKRATIVHPGKVVYLKGAWLDISSTLIRGKIRNAESIRFLVPDQVAKFIRKSGLYLR